MSTQSFADLGVSRAVVAGALAARGITEPFAIQRLVVADVLAGRDVLAKSPTGSGKTLAFAIPIVDRIEADGPAAPPRSSSPRRASSPPRSSRSRAPSTHARGAADRRRLRRRRDRQAGPQRAASRTSSSPRPAASRTCSRAARSRSSTSGSSSSTRPTGCSTWASSPPSTGSSPQCPRDRQTLFFSATLDGEAGRVAARLHARPGLPRARPAPARAADVEHRFVAVERDERARRAGRRARRPTTATATLVFVRTKRGADRLVKRLGGAGRTGRRHARRQVPAPAREGPAALRGRPRRHAGRDRRRRARHRRRRHLARHQLRSAGGPRGYVHRVGRTGRAGRTGVGITFVGAEQAADVEKIATDAAARPRVRRRRRTARASGQRRR